MDRSVRNKLIFIIVILLLVVMQQTHAQICMDPANVVYGLTNTGTLHPITVSTGAVGAQMNPLSGNAPVASNGVGYSPLNGKFYYFKRMPGSAPQEFVSFDPATNLYAFLATCPTTNYVYVGGINRLGTGYYCWDSNATLFYYNIASNTWTTITNSMTDEYGVDVSAIVRAHGSGDLAIDGMGNLIMLPSSNSRFAVYRMNAPLPTTPVANIVVTRLMPLTNPPAKFGGIALNATGEIFLNATSPTNGMYRLNQDFTLTFLSTVAAAMGDLTSCNFPFGVLAEGIKDFRAQLLSNGHVRLIWANPHQAYLFTVEHSSDGRNWKKITAIEGITLTLQYIHAPLPGNNYYRVYTTGVEQSKEYSEIKKINVASDNIIFFTNAVSQHLVVYNNADHFENKQLFITDVSGHQLIAVWLQHGKNGIDLSHLKRGCYFATLQSGGKRNTIKFIRE